VDGGAVVKCEKLAVSSAESPNVETMKQNVSVLATDANPSPSIDGCWFHRCEITPMGEELLPGFRYISPMFTTGGRDGPGNEVGSLLLVLAPPKTPFQAGCLINFDRTQGAQRKERKMRKLHKDLAKGLGVEADAEKDARLQAYARKMEEAEKRMEEEDEEEE